MIYDCSEMSACIDQARQHYDSMLFKEALRCGFFEMQAARDKYRELTQGDMHHDLVMTFIESQAVVLSPICPHITEHIWSLIGKVCTHVESLRFPYSVAVASPSA